MQQASAIFRARTDKDCAFSVIRANCSELRALCKGDSTTDGVDAAANDRITRKTAQQQAHWALETAKRFHCVVSASGKWILFPMDNPVGFLFNGSPMLGQITGTGCMSSAITGACCAVGPPLEAAILATSLMGICGEQAAIETKALGKGNGTFHQALLDALSTLTPEIWVRNLYMEGASL